MEQLYQDYKDIAEFRIVYIKEAHAIDSRRAVPYAIDEGIHQPVTYGDRCLIADMLLQTGTLTIPIIVDSIDDKVNALYQGLPSRVFLVRSDGNWPLLPSEVPGVFHPPSKKHWNGLPSIRKRATSQDLPINRFLNQLTGNGLP